MSAGKFCFTKHLEYHGTPLEGVPNGPNNQVGCSMFMPPLLNPSNKIYFFFPEKEQEEMPEELSEDPRLRVLDV